MDTTNQLHGKGSEMNTVLTIPEVAEQLRLSSDTVRKLLHEGRLKGIRSGRYGGKWRISQRAIDEFLLNDSPWGTLVDDPDSRR